MAFALSRPKGVDWFAEHVGAGHLCVSAAPAIGQFLLWRRPPVPWQSGLFHGSLAGLDMSYCATLSFCVVRTAVPASAIELSLLDG